MDEQMETPRQPDELPGFEDLEGRRWRIRLDVGLIERIHQQTGLDFRRVLEDKGAAVLRLADDPQKLCQVLDLCLEEQLEQSGLDKQQLARALDGDTLEAATEALMEAMVRFFPSRRRPLLRALAERMHTAEEELIRRMMSKLEGEEMGRAIERQADRMDREISQALRTSGGKSTE